MRLDLYLRAYPQNAKVKFGGGRDDSSDFQMKDIESRGGSMRIAQINMMHLGSTGTLMFSIAEKARQAGHEVWTFSPHYYQRRASANFPEIPGHQYYGTAFENMLHLRLSQVTGLQGCFSVLGTAQLLRQLDRIQPEVIHLHNLHNWTINLPMLFAYIKRKKIRVIWTLHDCWAFTGQCAHFTMCKCDKWKTGCGECSQIHVYPQTFVDRTAIMWKKKRQWFSKAEDLTFVTPSRWLADLVRQSFLASYPVRVINNGIDLSVFSENHGTFRKKHQLEGKKIVLGVAFDWGKRKGLDVFQRLAELLDDTYQIVLVGTNGTVDCELPPRILSIHRTADRRELAEIYSSADVFVNPTREDTFSMVNIEALACGTPVITFRTGGSPESLNATCGSVVDCDDVEAMFREIERVCNEACYSAEACRRRAEQYDQNVIFEEYVRLYEERQKGTL